MYPIQTKGLAHGIRRIEQSPDANGVFQPLSLDFKQNTFASLPIHLHFLVLIWMLLHVV